MIRLPQRVENERLDKMAAYIVQEYRAGVGLLALQEVSAPSSPYFRRLRARLAFMLLSWE
ncbi:hypothetical protein [Legionella sp. km772]|uniref:hypothetical protein n=1 Tax=Legionella sp. km772 TaxID=2498111 RepID=UPI000F8DCA42|nr:hypothetical protein [Legionella sp. km772]RUR12631.1 hypothetical protein ELY15_04550 [Legionella sp. km772]